SAASVPSASHRRPWSADAGHNCPHACPCGPRCARTSWLRKGGPPLRPEARSASLLPLTLPPRPSARGCVLRRSLPPALTAVLPRRPIPLPLPWLAPSSSPQRSRSSCLYQPPSIKLESNVRKKSYVIASTSCPLPQSGLPPGGTAPAIR